MALHYLKTWPDQFAAVRTQVKRFEVRCDDRRFAVGDRLILREFDPKTERYSGQSVTRRVTYVMRGFGIEPTHVALGIEP